MIGGLGVSAAVRDYSNFEQGLANVKAISQATAQEMQVLSKEAKRLGATTAWSAKDVTDAEKLLSQAGFKVQETITALPGLLDMASAGEIDLASATDIAAGTLRAFGMEAKKSAHVADVLALTASKTNSDITGIGESMKYVAPVSKSLGVSFEETSAAIGMLADANIKGSQAGTVLRASLARLANPSKDATNVMKRLGFTAFDAKGKMLPLSKVIGNLQHVTRKLSKQQKAQAISTIFGTEAMSGMMALVEQGPEKLSKLTKELENSDGAAKKMADTRLDSLQGQMTILKSAVEGMNIELGQRLAPYAKQFVTWFTGKIPDITNGIVKIVDKISELAHKFNELSPSTKKFIGYLSAGVVLFNPLNHGITLATKGIKGMIGLGGKLGKFFGIFKGATAAVEATTAVATGAESVAGATTVMEAATGATVAGSGAVGALGTSLGAIAGPVAIAVASIAALGYGGYKLNKYLKDDAIPAVDLFADRIEETTIVNKQAVGGIAKMHKTMSVEISKETKKAVGAYMELDKQASKSLMQLRANTNVFSKQSKDKVLNNFLEMSKKSNKINAEMKNNMVTNFKNLVSTTDVLTDENKTNIIKKYRDIVNGCSKLTDKQKQDTISKFTNMLNGINSATQDQKNNFMKIYTEMGNKITENIDKKKNEQLNSLKDLFSKSNVLSTKEESDILKKADETWNKKKAAVDNCQKQIDTIWQNAIQNHRQLSNEELQQINNYKEQMKTLAVKHLSEQEVESNIILERMKSSNERITAEIASENIKKLNEQRDNAVRIANEEYNQRISEIIRLRDESHVISAQQADALINDATRQRDEVVKSAEETRSQAVEQITSMDSTISSDVNTTTGELTTNWQRMKNEWDNWNPKEHNCVVNFFHRIFSSKKEITNPKENMTTEEFLKMKEGYATGTSNATSGIHEVAERGIEIVVGRQTKLFNGGEKVLNNRDSKKVLGVTNNEVSQEKSKPQFAVAQPQFAIAGGGNTNINVDVNNEFNNEADIDKIVAESAKQFGYRLKEALKNVKK